MAKLRYVSGEYLDALCPSLAETVGRILLMICAPNAVLQTILWAVGISLRPRFTITIALVGWLGVLAGGAVWFRLSRQRKRITNTT